MDEETLAVLALFRYDPKWLEYEFISPTLLHLQMADYRSRGYSSLEHYRYAAFLEVLASQTALTDQEVARYVELAQLDEDWGMAQAALCDLIQWSRLRDDQFNGLSEHPAFAVPRIQKIIARQRLISELTISPLTAELFARCLASADAGVQHYLLSLKLTKEQLQILVEQGASRKIRNMAKGRSRRRAIRITG